MLLMKRIWLVLVGWSVMVSTGVGQDHNKDLGETRSKLESVKISINEKDVPIGRVVDQIRKAGDLNIHIDPSVASDFGEEGPRITLVVEGVTLKTALKLALQKDDKYSLLYKEGVLLITVKGEGPSMVTRVYDVRDLLLKIQDFAGARVELVPRPTRVTAGAGGGGPIGGIFNFDTTAGEKLNIIDADFLQRMIRENTGEGSRSWAGRAALELKQGMLWVTQTKAMHVEVHRFIQVLRRIKR